MLSEFARINISCSCGDTLTLYGIEVSHVDPLLETWDSIHNGHSDVTALEAREVRLASLKAGFQPTLNNPSGTQDDVECQAMEKEAISIATTTGKAGRPSRPTGHRNITPSGKILIKLPDGSWMLEHRYVMEQYLGRKLLKNEQVKHVNEDGTDNSIDNLYLVTLDKIPKCHICAKPLKAVND